MAVGKGHVGIVAKGARVACARVDGRALVENSPMNRSHLALRRRMFVWLGCLSLPWLGALPSLAQVAPSASELSGYAAWHAAAHRGDLGAMTRLIGADADVNQREGHGRTALHVATHARQHEVLRLLVRAGADLNLLENDRYDAVTIAAVANDEETLRVLLSLGASAKLVTSRYLGTALIAAAHLGHHGVVKQLIDAGAPLDHVNNLHWTAVIEAIVLGDGGARHRETLRLLIGAGANLQLGDRQGHTPLQLARSRGHREMARMLEQAGAK
jgi:ankyrin repeat protein